MKKQSFLQGALILMLAGFINRIIGFALRIIIVRIIGDEGLGLFQMIYPLFISLLLLSTAGFPVAISKLIPERIAKNDYRGSYNLFKVALIFVFTMSVIIIFLLYFSADFIANSIYGDQRTYIIILAIIPALFISSLASCFRGFFQGMHTMLPTALSQITEQLSRLLATLMIINAVGYLGLKYQAAGIALGISIGEFCGLLLLISLFFFHLYSEHKDNLNHLKKRISENLKHNYFHDFKKIFKLAAPITMGRLVNSLMMSGEAVLIPRQLQAGGVGMKEATSLFGQLSGMVEQLLFLPTVITIALTTSLIPNVSEAYARKNLQKIKNNYHDVIRISCYLGLPITVIFIRMGTDICNLLFGYPEAGGLLAIMAFSATFIYYQQVSHGLLNGLGKPQLALINLIIGSGLKLVGIFYLTNHVLGIKGAAISIGLGIALSALLNFVAIGHNIGYKLDINSCFIKPILASFVLYLLEPFLKQMFQFHFIYINSKIRTILILILLIIIYLIVMFIIRAITAEDLKRFKR